MTDEFWEGAHERRDTHWLADSAPTAVLTLHGVDPPPGSRILDHGVGCGLMQSHLRSRGCDVVSCDIVPVFGAIHPDLIQHQAPFDYAISHLVAQHITDADLLCYANSLPMNAGAIATIQAASLDDGEPVDFDGPLLFRTRQQFQMLLPGWDIRDARRGIAIKGAHVTWHIASKRWSA